MNTVVKLLLNALAVFALSEILNGVEVNGYLGAVIVAVVLSILNLLVKPILVILTLPVTMLTLGFFLFIVNALIVLLADKLVDGFRVDGLWTAVMFSILLCVVQSVLQSFIKTEKKKL
ncbi:MAG: phage holin family protein [Winogradskyella sp.]|uniref:phage holin family protein n=1 Tax=Winogradskyella sp. TaxID=1883156 RepID=UPI0025FD3A0A|nr:phage holin family protein [Winogradskyella sp.]NRB83060.1 phage holin family protein [Winogradskyella sp.]